MCYHHTLFLEISFRAFFPNTVQCQKSLSVSCSVMSDSWIPWTIACQAPLSMEFHRQEYWSGLSFPSPGDLPYPGIEPASAASAGRFFTPEPPGKLLK